MQDFVVANADTAAWQRHTADEVAAGADPDLRFAFLVDAREHASEGLSIGCLELPVGGALPPHSHAPQELYIVRQGRGILHMPDGEIRTLSEGDVVYIPPGARHGLSNEGDGPFTIWWVFPTDSFADVAYRYEQG